MEAEEHYSTGDFVCENSEPLVCRLEEGVVSTTGLTMVMFHENPLMRRVTKIIDRVVEVGYIHLLGFTAHELA
jgi:hypothetical protein